MGFVRRLTSRARPGRARARRHRARARADDAIVDVMIFTAAQGMHDHDGACRLGRVASHVTPHHAAPVSATCACAGLPRPPLRVAFLGMGEMGQLQASIIARRSTSESLAMVRRSWRVPGVAWGGCYDPKLGHTDADRAALLRDPAVDAVYICAPDELHPQLVLEAIAQGKHVLCEKPLAFSEEICKQLVAAAQAAGVVLRVDVMRRFDPQLAPAAAYARSLDRAPLTVLMDDRSTKPHGSDTDTASCIRQGLVHNLDFVVHMFWPYRSCEVVRVQAAGSTLRVELCVTLLTSGESTAITLLYSRQHWAYRQTCRVGPDRQFGSDFMAQLIDRSAWSDSDGHRWDLFSDVVERDDMPIAPPQHRGDRAMMLERYIEAYTRVWRDFALRIREPASWLATTRQQQVARLPGVPSAQPTNHHNRPIQSQCNLVAEGDVATYASYVETSRLVEAVCEAAGVGA